MPRPKRGRVVRTPENVTLVARITGPAATHGEGLRRLILDDGQCRRVNGRYIAGNVLVPDENGNPLLHKEGDRGVLVTRRHRFRIPKGHPWRGARPTE